MTEAEIKAKLADVDRRGAELYAERQALLAEALAHAGAARTDVLIRALNCGAFGVQVKAEVYLAIRPPDGDWIADDDRATHQLRAEMDRLFAVPRDNYGIVNLEIEGHKFNATGRWNDIAIWPQNRADVEAWKVLFRVASIDRRGAFMDDVESARLALALLAAADVLEKP